MRVRLGHVTRLLDLFEPRAGQTTLRRGYPGSQIGHLGSHEPAAALVTYGEGYTTTAEGERVIRKNYSC